MTWDLTEQTRVTTTPLKRPCALHEKYYEVLIRRLRTVRFRAISFLDLHPGPVTVMLGHSNAGKSSLLAALDLLLHPGVGRPRALTELGYFRRDPEAGLEVEAVLGDLPRDLVTDAIDHIEGWSSATQRLPGD